MATGLAVWLGSAKSMYGSTSVASTGQILPCVYGTVASCFSPLLYTLVISLIKPQDFNWADFRKKKLAFEAPEGDGSATNVAIKEELNESPDTPGSQPHLRRWARIAAYWSIATFLGHWVLWPLPMYAAKYIFSRRFFESWLVVAIIWIWCTLLIAGFFPLIGGRRQFVAIYRVLRYGRQDGGDGATSPSTAEGEKTPTPIEIIEGKQ